MKSIRSYIENISNISEEIDLLNEAQSYENMLDPLWTFCKHWQDRFKNKIEETKDDNGFNYAEYIINKLDKQNIQAEYDVPGMIKNARSILKKNDRVVWFLKLFRLGILANLYKAFGVTQVHPNVQNLAVELDNAFKNYLQKESQQFDDRETRNLVTNSSRMLNELGHYLSLPIPEIQNTVFLRQNPVDLIVDFQNAEKKWKEENRQSVTQEEHHEILLKFPDGKCWFNLNQEYCEREGLAMGHCGNKAAYQEGDRVLSLREPAPQKGRWRPILTFILHEDGFLGEMKGRGNDKPAEKYHPYIIELLKLPMIKGIRGGGYNPKNNFDMSDLTEKQQDELVNLKPSLGTMLYQYNKFGMTDGVKEQIVDKLESMNWPRVSYRPSEYDFVCDDVKNIKELIDNFTDSNSKSRGSDNSLEYAYSVISGDEYLDTFDWVNDDDEKRIMQDLPEQILNEVAEYLKKNYSDQYDFTDEEDSGELYDIIREQENDLLDTLRSAAAEGYRSGTESEIYKEFMNALNSWNYKGFHFEFKHHGDSNNIDLDEPAKLIIGEKDFVENLSDQEYLADAEDDHTLWILNRSNGPSLEQPRYGWSDFDMKAATDYFEETMHEVIDKKQKDKNQDELDLKKNESIYTVLTKI